MIYRFFDLNELSENQIARYYSMLSDKKKAKIASLPDAARRIEALSAEMIARQALSELLDAPEFSFSLLIDVNGKSAVGNYSAYLSVARAGDLLCCAVSGRKVGVALSRPRAFSFSQAQALFTDTEIRDIFSGLDDSFARLINLPEIKIKAATEKFALYEALKYSYFRAKGRVTGRPEAISEFRFDGENYVCSDREYVVKETGKYENIIFAITEESKP